MTTRHERNDKTVATIHATVSYSHEREVYSDITIDGKPAVDIFTRKNTIPTLTSEGEFGAELVDLFSHPGAVKFGYEGDTVLNGTPAVKFRLDVPKDKNSFWNVSDDTHTVAPEFRGSIWIETTTSRLLRLELEPVHLNATYISRVMKYTDYEPVSLGEAGVHVLPVSGQTRGCNKPPPGTKFSSSDLCLITTLEIHGCRRFVGKARIITGQPQKPPQF